MVRSLFRAISCHDIGISINDSGDSSDDSTTLMLKFAVMSLANKDVTLEPVNS